jgi:hypothetical protein
MRAELVTQDLCSDLRRMNLRRSGIGAESGSERILKLLKGAGSSVHKNQSAIDMLDKNGIKSGAGFIFGHWQEKESDIHKTYEFILRNYSEGKFVHHTINVLMPMPPTPIWDYAVQKGHVLGSGFKWSQLSYVTVGLDDIGGSFARRIGNDSIYLNEHNVPQEQLFDIIADYEQRIASGRFGVPGKKSKLKRRAIAAMPSLGGGARARAA